MSVTTKDMQDRIANLQAYWRDRGLPALRAHIVDPQGLVVRNKDPFGAMLFYSQMQDNVTPEVLKQNVSEIITKLRENAEFPSSMNNKGGIFDTMEGILKGEIGWAPMQGQEFANMPLRPRLSKAPLDNTPEVKITKITRFFRNTRHKEFMKGLSGGVQDLRTWLEDFYCKQYLQGDAKDASKQKKAEDILYHLRNNIPPADMTIDTYLTRFGYPSLVSLIGANRQSSSDKKVPWGLAKISEEFGYQINKATDIKAKPRKYKESMAYISL